MKKHLLLICLTLGTIISAQGQCPQNADIILHFGLSTADLIADNGGNNTFNNLEIVIYGDLPIDDDLVFNNCDIYMGPNASIKMLSPNNHLVEISNSNIQACTDYMWEGISLQFGTINLENTQIRDALIGVDVQSIQQSSLFLIDDCQFLNNYQHLKVGNQINTSSFVHATSFDVQGNLLPPHADLDYAEMAVAINNVLDWAFGSPDPALSNYINNFKTGLQATNVRLDLMHTHFSNPIFGGSGIVAQGQGPQNHHLNVGNCSFSLLALGIDVSYLNALVKNNQFTNCDYGVQTRFSKGKELNIEFNTFTDGNKVAIFNFADDGATSRIGKNTIINTYQAISTYNLNGSDYNTDYMAKANCVINADYAVTIVNTPQAQLYHNHLQANQVGLSLAGSQEANIFGNDFLGSNAQRGLYASLSPQTHYNENRFRGFTYGMHLANDYHSQLTNNVFMNGNVGIYLSNNTELGEQGSLDQPQNNHWLQPHFQEFGNNVPIDADPNLDENDATFFYTPNVAELYPWNNNVALTIPTNNGVLPPPYAYFECQGLLPEDLPPAGGIVPPVPSELADYSPSRYIQELQLLALLDQLPPEQLSTEHHDFVSQKHSSTQEHIVRLRQEVEQAHYAQAHDRNQGISPANPIEDFTKTFYSALLVWLQDSLPFENLTPQEQATLREWAALCPFEYGSEVYSARAIAHRIDTAWQSYAHPCEGSIPHTLARLPGTEEGLRAYPNPFVDELHIESTAQRLVLYDLLGRVQHQQALQENSSKLDLKHLPLGMYLLKTYDDQGNQIGQDKLLKIRQQ